MLMEAAAEQWGVPMGECRAANSVITHVPTGRSTTYGRVAAAAAEMFPPEHIELKDPKDWKIIGKPVKRLDTADKLNGRQVFGVDLELPGMLNAAIRACPVFGGTLNAFDAAKVREMPGVRAVVAVDDYAVAVVAETWWQAKTALDALPITWDEGPNAKVSSASIDHALDECRHGGLRRLARMPQRLRCRHANAGDLVLQRRGQCRYDVLIAISDLRQRHCGIAARHLRLVVGAQRLHQRIIYGWHVHPRWLLQAVARRNLPDHGHLPGFRRIGANWAGFEARNVAG